MSEIPDYLKYTESHEWIRSEDDGTLVIGITDHAQELLGDLVYVEVPEVGRVLAAREEFAVVESVKAASDVYSPISGEVLAVNEDLADTPEVINGDPYGDGWLVRIRPEDPLELDSLLDPVAYAELVAQEEE